MMHFLSMGCLLAPLQLEAIKLQEDAVNSPPWFPRDKQVVDETGQVYNYVSPFSFFFSASRHD